MAQGWRTPACRVGNHHRCGGVEDTDCECPCHPENEGEEPAAVATTAPEPRFETFSRTRAAVATHGEVPCRVASCDRTFKSAAGEAGHFQHRHRELPEVSPIVAEPEPEPEPEPAAPRRRGKSERGRDVFEFAPLPDQGIGRASPLRDTLAPLVEKLRAEPGEWARLLEYDRLQGAAGAKQRADKLYPDITFTTRKAHGGSTLWGCCEQH